MRFYSSMQVELLLCYYVGGLDNLYATRLDEVSYELLLNVNLVILRLFLI